MIFVGFLGGFLIFVGFFGFFLTESKRSETQPSRDDDNEVDDVREKDAKSATVCHKTPLCACVRGGDEGKRPPTRDRPLLVAAGAGAVARSLNATAGLHPGYCFNRPSGLRGFPRFFASFRALWCFRAFANTRVVVI